MVRLPVFICLCFACYIHDSYAARRKMTEVAYVNLLESCPGVPATRSFYNSSFDYHGKDDFRINVYIVLNSTYKEVEAIHDISVCSSKEKESCQKFLYFNVDDFCEAARKEDGFWNMVLDSFVPPIKCPLQGTYILKGYPVSEITPAVKKFLGVGLMSGSDLYYDRITLKHKKEIIFCVDLMSSFHLLLSKQPRQ